MCLFPGAAVSPRLERADWAVSLHYTHPNKNHMCIRTRWHTCPGERDRKCSLFFEKKYCCSQTVCLLLLGTKLEMGHSPLSSDSKICRWSAGMSKSLCSCDKIQQSNHFKRCRHWHGPPSVTKKSTLKASKFEVWGEGRLYSKLSSFKLLKGDDVCWLNHQT